MTATKPHMKNRLASSASDFPWGSEGEADAVELVPIGVAGTGFPSPDSP